MRLFMYTIYDEKAEVFMPPFFVPTIGIATRAFGDCVNSTDHQFAKHPQDYTLFSLGEFNQDSAHIDQQEKHSVGNGVEFINPLGTPITGEKYDGASNSPIQPDQTG